MRKKERQRLIQKMLREHEIKKQEDFVNILAEMDVKVTQATISRDIKEMQLIKVPIEGNEYRYSMPAISQHDLALKVIKLLKDSFVSIDQMDKFVVIHTIPGNAPALGNLLEKTYEETIFTVISNDNKVMLITRQEEKAVWLKTEILNQV